MASLQRFITRLTTLAGILVALGVGFLLGQAIDGPRPVRTLEFMRALPPPVPDCVAATPDEQAMYQLALSVLRQKGTLVEQGGSVLWFDLGATRFLARGLYRYSGNDHREIAAVCPPEGFYAQVAAVLDTYRTILSGRPTELELDLFAKFPPLPYFVERVATSAFNETSQESEMRVRRDVRPYARSILALYGDAALEWRDQAFAQISAADAMGTGAAQIAVATHHPDALDRSETLMRELLAGVSPGAVVPYETKYRLYELAHALALGGEDAKAHTAPLHDLMGRLVQSWAGHFGFVELPPKQMCHVLEAIEGKAALALYGFCLDDSVSDA